MARRRRRGRSSGQNPGSGGGGNQKAQQRRKRAPKKRSGVGFWGHESQLPDAPEDLRITDDPAAVARSLGPPPLPGHEMIAEHFFAAVYDRAVTVAGAVAAASGLIAPEELQEELAD